MASTFLASEAEEIDESACLASLFNRLIALFPYTIAYINTNNHIYTLTNITLQISVCGGVLVTITVCTLEFRGNQYEPVLVSFANLNLQVLLNVSNNYAPEQSWAALGRQWSTVTETLPVDDTSSSMPQDNLSHAPYLSNVGRLSSLSSIANPPPQTKSMPT